MNNSSIKIQSFCITDVLHLRKLILQSSRHFSYVTTHSPTLLSLYLHHSSFSNPSVTSPTSQFILQPLFCFSYVTSSSLNSPGEPPMIFFPIVFRFDFLAFLPSAGEMVNVLICDVGLSWHLFLLVATPHSLVPKLHLGHCIVGTVRMRMRIKMLSKHFETRMLGCSMIT